MRARNAGDVKPYLRELAQFVGGTFDVTQSAVQSL